MRIFFLRRSGLLISVLLEDTAGILFFIISGATFEIAYNFNIHYSAQFGPIFLRKFSITLNLIFREAHH